MREDLHGIERLSLSHTHTQTHTQARALSYRAPTCAQRMPGKQGRIVREAGNGMHLKGAGGGGGSAIDARTVLGYPRVDEFDEPIGCGYDHAQYVYSSVECTLDHLCAHASIGG